MLEDSYFLLGIKGLHPFVTNKKVLAITFMIYDSVQVLSILFALLQSDLDIDGILDCLSSTAAIVQAINKEIILFVHKNKFANTIRRMEKFWPHDHFGEETAKKLEHNRNIIRKLLRLYRGLFLFGGALYFLKPFYDDKRALPLYWTTFCDIQASVLCFAANYVGQILYGASGLSMIVGFDILFLALLSYGYCEFEQVKYALLDINVSEHTVGDETSVLKDIYCVVQHHNFVLEFIQEVNQLVTYLLLHQFSSNLFGICAILFLITSKGFPPSLSLVVRFAPFIAGHLFQIFTYCAAGELISGQSESIASAAYESKWWVKHQPSLRKIICLVIQRSQIQLKVTAGGVWDLNLVMFVSIIKGSFSMLTFMQTMYQPK